MPATTSEDETKESAGVIAAASYGGQPVAVKASADEETFRLVHRSRDRWWAALLVLTVAWVLIFAILASAFDPAGLAGPVLLGTGIVAIFFTTAFQFNDTHFKISRGELSVTRRPLPLFRTRRFDCNDIRTLDVEEQTTRDHQTDIVTVRRYRLKCWLRDGTETYLVSTQDREPARELRRALAVAIGRSRSD